jgi:hypothetical protein
MCLTKQETRASLLIHTSVPQKILISATLLAHPCSTWNPFHRRQPSESPLDGHWENARWLASKVKF